MRKLLLSLAMVIMMASIVCTAQVAGLPSGKLIKVEKYKIRDNNVSPQKSTTSTGEPTHGCQGEFKPGITNEKVDDVASIISESFEDYAANDYLVQQAINQGKAYWTTWSNSPGSSEDPLVSDAFAYEGDNSVSINGTNDAILLFNDTGFTEGQFDIDFMVLIPAGFNGYFSTLQYFNGASSELGMQAYFDAGGAGLVDAGGAGAGIFSYTYDTWHNVHLMIDLDMDYAEMYFNGEMIVSWVWSSGSFGIGTINELHAMNFYAWADNGTPGAHFDNIDITSEDIQPPYGDPPTNLVGEFIEQNIVLLTWDAPGTYLENSEKHQPAATLNPKTRAFTGYNVYRDGTKIAANVQETEYLDFGLIPYTIYTWWVTAQYDEGESVPSNTIQTEISSVNEIYEKSLSIYPNPTNGIVNIKSDVNLKSVRLVNLTGQVVYFRNLSGMELQINASEFGVGIYTIQLETEAGLAVRKLIVQ